MSLLKVSLIVQHYNKYGVMVHIYYSTDDGYTIVGLPRYTICDVFLGKETAVVVLYFPTSDRTLEFGRPTGQPHIQLSIRHSFKLTGSIFLVEMTKAMTLVLLHLTWI